MAVDQIALLIQEMRVKEGSAFTAVANFRTRATAAASTPTTVHYRIDCLTTGIEVAGWTSVSPVSSVSIPVTAMHNAIQGSSDEVKQLTVVADRGLASQYVETACWSVENLFGSP